MEERRAVERLKGVTSGGWSRWHVRITRAPYGLRT